MNSENPVISPATRTYEYAVRPRGRLGNWKLIEWFEDGRLLELFNLRVDPGETENLISKRSGRAKELLVMLRQWRREVDAKMPTATR